MPAKLFLVRGVIAIAWAAAFATMFDALTTGTAVLLVIYPLVDAVASVVDARNQSGGTRRWLLINAAISTVTAALLGIAATGDKGDVLAVFGVWALLSGIAQFVVAWRRRATFGWQWPMLAAGSVSTIFGVLFVLMSGASNPTLMPLVVYAGTGGVDFIIEAWLLRRRFRTASMSTRDSVDASTSPLTPQQP
ncbi:DUF308 domain-containing protein [Monashia sp. NPDC004114]